MIILMIIIGLLNKIGCFKQPPQHVSEIESSNDFSKAQDYIDSLEKRAEIVLLDTFITHFGNHPGHIEYDTTYIVSYKTRNPKKAKLVFKNAQKK